MKSCKHAGKTRTYCHVCYILQQEQELLAQRMAAEENAKPKQEG